MDLELWFSAAGAVALSGWALLALFPRRAWATDLVCGLVLPALLSLGYVVLVALFLGRAEGGFGSLAEVARLFETRGALLAGWVHYLAFDLFIGAWQAREARRAGMPYPALLPCLVLTFLLGPAGLLLFLALRAALARRRAGAPEPTAA